MARSNSTLTHEINPNRQSALAHRKTLSGDDGLTMQEAAHLGKIVLRLDATIA